MLEFFFFLPIPVVLMGLWVANLRYIYQNMPEKAQFWTYRRFRLPIWIVIMILTTLLVVNVFVPEEDYSAFAGREAIEEGNKTGDPRLLARGYRDLLEEEPLNSQYHYRYIMNTWRTIGPSSDVAVERKYRKMMESSDSATRSIGVMGLGVQLSERYMVERFERDVLPFYSPNDPYYYYCLGNNAFANDLYDSAYACFRRDIELGGDAETTVGLWTLILREQNQTDSLVVLAYSDFAPEHMEPTFLAELYFKQGDIRNYSWAIIRTLSRNWNTIGILASLLAALTWMIYLIRLNFFRVDQSRSMLALVFIAGIATSFLVFPLSDFFEYVFNWKLNGGILNDFIYCVVGIGAVEEAVKILPVFLLLRLGKLKDPFDYIIYGATSALGFAFNENLLYYSEGDFGIIHLRAVISVLGHMFFTCTITYGWMTYRFKEAKMPFWRVFLTWFFLAAFFHGVYDFFLINPYVSEFAILSIVLYLCIIHLWGVYKNNALNNSMYFDKNIPVSNSFLESYLGLSLLSILMFQYAAEAYEYAPEVANNKMLFGSFYNGYLILFIALTYSRFDIVKGYWQPLKIPLTFLIPKTRLPQNHIGLELVMHRRSNSKIAPYLPQRGRIIDRKVIGDDTSWFLVQLEGQIPFKEILKDKVMINCRSLYSDLDGLDPVAIQVLLIPENTNLGATSFTRQEFITAGAAISRRSREKALKDS